MVRIEQLQPGARFRNGVGRTGRLVRLGEGSAVVQYEGGSDKNFVATEYDVEDGEVKKHVAFRADSRPVTISLASEVEPLEVEA